MRSAKEQADVVTNYLQDERAQQRVIDPPFSGGRTAHLSPFGVIPKPRQPGKWRLILDLSSPHGHSVNDGIDPHLCSLSYSRVDDATTRILALGRGTLLAKMEIQSAYQLISVHLDDRHLLGMRWRRSVTLDAALPFGLRSAPKIFSAVADALLWVMFRRGVSSAIHYLDDFLFCGAAGSGKRAHNLASALTTCRDLGVPVAEHKTQGPSTVLTFLGIEIDTVHMQLRLPSGKLARLQNVLLRWSTRRGGTKRELLSLIGSLHHACEVIKPGRAFLRRLIELSKVPKALHHFVRLNKEARADISWWAAFASRWNGIGLLSALGKVRPTVCLESDASGSWGCGAVWQHRWLQLEWGLGTERLGIAAKETIPVVLAAVC